jgi:hypothetical protein
VKLVFEKSYHGVKTDEDAANAVTARGTSYLFFECREKFDLEILKRAFFFAINRFMNKTSR